MACKTGTFTTEPNAEDCSPWTECAEEVRPGSATSDRVCAPESWVRQFAATYARAAAVDASGNVVVAGSSGADAFVRKYDTNGTIVWDRGFGTTSIDTANSVNVGSGGDIYVVGSTLGALVQPSNGGQDGYIRKYDSAGAVLWTVQLGRRDQNFANASSLDTDGNILVAGSDSNGVAGASDAFAAKYDSAGKWLWGVVVGSTGVDSAAAIGADDDGNVYVAGSASGALYEQTSLGSSDAFVRKYDAQGTVLWTRQFGTTQPDYIQALHVDGSGNLYLCGITSGALPTQTHAGDTDAFVRKYDRDGNELWTRQFGTSASDSCQSAITDAAGKLYVAGTTAAALDSQPHLGGEDAFARSYEPDGELAWTRQLGTSVQDAGEGIALDAAGSIFVVGYTAGAFPGQKFEGQSYNSFVSKWVR